MNERTLTSWLKCR